MKRHALPVLSVLLPPALPCPKLSAQIVPFLGGGVALGMGDVGDDSDAGWLVLGGVHFAPSWRHRLSLGYSLRHEPDARSFARHELALAWQISL